MRKSKKGISPLIATVLIIAFTIAVAVIIMAWGTNFVRETTEDTGEATEKELACATKLSFDVQATLSGSVSSPESKIAIDNKGETDIARINWRTYDAEGNVYSGVFEPDSGEVYLRAFSAITETDTKLDNMETIELVATILTPNGEEFTCSNAVASADVIDKTTLAPGV